MQENLMAWKASIVAFFVATASFLGWKGVLVVIWALVMGIDYVSGTVAAIKNHEWCSEEARAGLWHKAGMVFVVLVATITDLVLYITMLYIPKLGIEWPVLVMPVVVSWYVVTELGSILENAAKMDAPVPPWLIAVLKVSKKAMDSVGEKVANNMDNKEEMKDD